MSTFGRRGGGGRRQAPREPLPIPAVISTVDESRAVVIMDLSASGARLRGHDLPPEGDAMWVKIDSLRRFAIIAWSTGDECGIEFDTRIEPFEAARLRREVKAATLTAGTVERRLAKDDWESGFAR